MNGFSKSNMILGYEHLVNYVVKFGFDKSGDETDWVDEYLTSISIAKVTEKKPVFSAGRKLFAAIEENVTMVAGKIVVPALDTDAIS